MTFDDMIDVLMFGIIIGPIGICLLFESIPDKDARLR